MQFNVPSQEILLRMAYVGPAQAGKRTNLQEMHRLLDPRSVGRMGQLVAGNDAAPAFDLLPAGLAGAKGYRLKVKLIAVPWTLQHVASRRILLAGVDGLVFVAHSDPGLQPHNQAAWEAVEAALTATGADPRAVPTVWQCNKQDLADALAPAAVPRPASAVAWPALGATARAADGVAEALHAMLETLLARLEQRYSLAAKFDLDGDDVLEQIFAACLPSTFAARRQAQVTGP